MPTRLNINYPRLTDSDEFEDLLRDLCADEWGDPETKKYGRRGQNQQGLDIYGKPVDGGGVYRAVQCKLRTTDAQLSKNEIDHEVAAAEKFPHKLDLLIIATDAPRYAPTQILVDQVSDQQARRGKFRVAIWFWDDITARMAAFPRLLLKYNKDLFASLTTLPFAERLVGSPLHIVTDTSEVSADVHQLDSELRLRGLQISEWIRGRSGGQTQSINEALEDGVIYVLNLGDARRERARHLIAAVSDLQNYIRRSQAGLPLFLLLPLSNISEFNKVARESALDLECIRVFDSDQSASELADEIFKIVFGYGYFRRGGLSTIELSARTTDRLPNSALLDMDWRHGLNTQIFPTEAVWNSRFVPALRSVQRRILEQGDTTRIHINCQLPIPAAMALGFYLNLRLAPVGVWSRKSATSDFRRQFWHSDAPTTEITLDSQWVLPIGNSPHSATIEVTTYVSIHEAVRSYVSASGLNVDCWLNLCFPHDTLTDANLDENQAVAFANEVGRSIRQLNAQGITDIHLFARIPSALAVLVGQRLQACGRIHLYWFNNPTYQHAFVLF